MPIEKEEFMKTNTDFEAEIIAFLRARKEKAFTAEEIMKSTSFHVDFDSPVTFKTSTFIVSNFVAVLHDLAGKGQLAMKVVNNRMHFTSTK